MVAFWVSEPWMNAVSLQWIHVQNWPKLVLLDQFAVWSDQWIPCNKIAWRNKLFAFCDFHLIDSSNFLYHFFLSVQQLQKSGFLYFVIFKACYSFCCCSQWTDSIGGMNCVLWKMIDCSGFAEYEMDRGERKREIESVHWSK